LRDRIFSESVNPISLLIKLKISPLLCQEKPSSKGLVINFSIFLTWEEELSKIEIKKETQMARLFEFQGKGLLKEVGIKVPEGEVASTPQEARGIAERLAKPVVLKIQIWKTGRKALGGIRIAETPEDAEREAKELLGMSVGELRIERILVEEKLNIEREFFAAAIIDDSEKAPLIIFSSVGGTGIEEIAKEHPKKIAKERVNIFLGFTPFMGRRLAKEVGIKGKLITKIGDTLYRLYQLMRKYDARSAEINPLVLTKEGEVYAADCHIVIDDYAVYRHPELGIEIAREFDRPPTELEKIAYRVEAKDYRGTFYFFQMRERIEGENYIGFHGAGGGGSMISMDAVQKKGFRIANFCDTSGNPPASKVYRAAKIILSQPNIVGYFASGSGVASQEQYHSARGIVKAFLEEELEIPAVIRLGGNYEEKAIEILHTFLKGLKGIVEGYGRDDSPDFCADRLKKLVEEGGRKRHKVRRLKEFVSPPHAYSFETLTGKIYIDHRKCLECGKKGCVEECLQQILRIEDGKPLLAIPSDEAKRGKCTECLACEIYCKFFGKDAIVIELPIPGLKEYREKILKEEKR